MVEYEDDALMSASMRKQYSALRAEPIVADFWFGPRVERSRMRQALGVAPDAVVMVTVAGLARCQGHLAILSALSRTPASVCNRLKWLIVGQEIEADYVEELIAGIALTKCDVRLLGPLATPIVRDIYCASDLFCLAAIKDASSPAELAALVYLEAAACGLPSIASAIGGDADTVIDNETGRLVEPSVEALTEAITELTLDGIKRISLGWRAWARARKICWKCGNGEAQTKRRSDALFARNLETIDAASAAGKFL
jgi:phosphatidyl-myo-inositol dimannoside synthase